MEGPEKKDARSNMKGYGYGISTSTMQTCNHQKKLFSVKKTCKIGGNDFGELSDGVAATFSDHI